MLFFIKRNNYKKKKSLELVRPHLILTLMEMQLLGMMAI